MKTFRWFAAGAAVGLLSLLVVWRQETPSRHAEANTTAEPQTRTEALAPLRSPTVTAPLGHAEQSASATVANTATVAAPTSSIRSFESWAREFAQAPAAQRAALLGNGEKLAEERRAEMAQLIRSNPDEAIARALPYGLRKQLPSELLAKIEQPISGRGNVRPLIYEPLPGLEKECPADAIRVEIGKKSYRAYSSGDRMKQPAHRGAYLAGVAIESAAATEEPIMALSASIMRRVSDADEIADLKRTGRLKTSGKCPACGRTGNKQSAVIEQFGENYYTFCSPADAAKFETQLTSIHKSVWSATGAGNVIEMASQTYDAGFGEEQGIHKLLYIRVIFADDPQSPQDDDAAQATVKDNNHYFNEGSYNTVWWETDVTPVIRLPQRKNYYAQFPEGLMISDAKAGAAALGYFSGDYFFTYVLCNSIREYKFGGISDGLLNGSPGAIKHELGHDFGLGHANFYQPEGTSPGPVQPTNGPPYPIDPDSLLGHNDINAPTFGLSGNQPSYEYGNLHDVMGSGGGHFSAMFKNQMGWLPDPFVKTVTGSTTNRIYAFDTPSIFDGRFYAMKIRKAEGTNYWLSYRQGFPDNDWFSNGIEVTWDRDGENVLIDTTPDSTYGRQDAALVVGRTLNDPAAAIHITPIAIGGGPEGSNKWIDVVVQVGRFPNNNPPTVSVSASNMVVPVGTTVNFQAAAQDPDGDQLAYAWTFGDYTFGTNGAVQSKTFNAAGYYVVRCEVSDMKGAVASASVVVTVGTPDTYTISGRVLDIYGNPVQGVRVHNSRTRPTDSAGSAESGTTGNPVTDIGSYRYGFSDSDGTYVIGNVSPGTYTNRAYLYGYRIEPFNFTDPLVITDGNAYGLDFIATPIPRVSISDSLDADESGTEGIFTVTRTGDIGDDLHVKFVMGGTAVLDTDYTISGADTTFTNITIVTNGNIRVTNETVYTTNAGQIIIPAGQSFVDIHIQPIDNTIGDGNKTVILSLALQTNDYRYVTYITNILTTNGSVVVTNSRFVTATNQVRIPGWELRASGPSAAQTWFQTDPTYVLDQGEAYLEIVDDDLPEKPTVTAEVVGFSAMESRGDSAVLVFTRSGAPVGQPLDVYYDLSGDASNGVDYVRLPGKVTIPAGQYYALVQVRAINDLFVEGDEFGIVQVRPDAAYNSEDSGAYFMIVDDDLPQVNIFAATANAARNGGSGRVTFSRAGTLDQPLVVNYLVTGTAVPGVDFQPLAGSVTIPAGQLSADVVITPIASSTNPLPRTVAVQVADSTTYNVYYQNTATVTIFDSTLPTVNISSSAGTVAEGSSFSFTISRSGPTTSSLNVFFDVGGSAWESIDYSAIGTNVVIPAGASSATINVNTINDGAREFGDVDGDENIIVQLRTGTNYLLGANDSRTVTITDGDSGALPAVGFMLASSSAREDAGIVNLYLKVSANPATNKPIQIEYRVTGGSAIANVNYSNYFGAYGTTGILDVTHYFPPRTPDKFYNFEKGIYSIPVRLLNDQAASGNKTVIISLFNPTRYETNISYATNNGIRYTNVVISHIPTNAFLGPSVTHTLTILDVGVTSVGVTAVTNIAYEGGAPGRFVITRTGPTNAALTVGFAVTGTAASGNDYNPVPGNGLITIPAGTNSVVVNVTPRDDQTEELFESVTLTLLPRNGYTLGNRSDTVYILSDDGTVQFQLANFEYLENAGTGTVSVVRTGNTNTAFTVSFVASNGTATAPADFIATNGTLNFAPGETLKTFDVTLINDDVVEPDETIALALVNPSGGIKLGGQKTAVLTIVNDDTEFNFAKLSFRANENAGWGQVDIARSGVITNSQVVTFVATNGMADENDFVPTTIEVPFAPGETNVSVYVPILDDALFEGDESITLLLESPGAGASLGSVSNATLVIVDDECKLQFQFDKYYVNEYSNTVTLTVHRDGGTVNPLTATYSFADGTASNGLDYAAQAGVITFTGDHYELDTNGTGQLLFVPGESDKTITVTIIDDVLGEGNEDFFVTVSDPATVDDAGLPGSVTIGSIPTTEVAIIDDEMPGNVDYQFGGLGPNARVRATSLQDDGKVVIGGDFTQVDGFSFIRVARLSQDGRYDGGFNPGLGANAPVYALASLSDGKVYVGGDFTRMNNTNRVRLARLNADGSLDLSFALNTNGFNGIVRAIVVQTNGQVVVGGDFTSANGVNRSHLARLNSDGTLDTNYTASANGNVYALRLQPDGKLLVGGTFTTVNTSNRNAIARLNASGTLDSSFVAGSGFNGAVNSIALQADGSLLVGGAFTSYAGVTRNALAHLSVNGALDAAFAPGSGPNGAVNAVGVAPNGKIIIAGDFTAVNGISAGHFARLRANGSLDLFYLVGSGADATVRTLVVQSDTEAVIGGDFNFVHGIARNYVARIHGDEKSNIASVEVASANLSVSEDAGPALVTLIRSGNTNVEFTLTYSTYDGTATSPLDYIGVTNTLQFVAGQTSAVIAIDIVNDPLLEGDETFGLFITATAPNVDLSGATNATITILDDEKAIQFTSTRYIVNEGGTNAVITLSRIGGQAGDISALFFTSNRTATAGQDYAMVSNTVSFSAGQTSAVVLVPIIDDATGEANEELGLYLANPVNCFLGSPSNALLTIIDNDFTFGVVTYSNNAAITILDAQPASPYPASITVSGLTGVLSHVAVQFVGLYHTFPSDIDALLVGPSNQTVMLMSDAGGNFPAANLRMTFDDDVNTYQPSNAVLVASTNRPTDYGPADVFPSTAPAGPYGNALSTFIGANPNGTYKLYIVDDRGNDSGVISNGWRLILTTVDYGRAADLAITGSGPSSTTAGDVVRYSYTVRNNGPNGAANVIFSNAIPSGMTPLATYPSQGSCAVVGGAVVCDLGFLASNDVAVVDVKMVTSLGGVWTNVTTVTTTDPDVIASNNVARVVTTVAAGTTADLLLTMTDSPDPVLQGQNIAYTIVVSNRGPLTATGVVLTDYIPENGILAGVGSTQGSFSNNASAVFFNIGTIPFGGKITATVLIQPRSGGFITNTANVTANEPDLTGNVTTEVTTVSPAADLVLSMGNSPDPIATGQSTVYSLTVYNAGPAQADNVTIFDVLPPGFQLLGVNSSTGTNSVSGGTVTFSLGSLPFGASATATLSLKAPVQGTFTNFATALASQADPNTANNSAIDDITVFPVISGSKSGITVTPTTNATQLAAMVAGSGNGLQVRSTRLQAQVGFNGETSSGIYTISSAPSTYSIRSSGIVLSTGDVKDYETGPNRSGFNTTSYGPTATPEQQLLLDPITTDGTNHWTHHDVTQFDIDFDMLPGFGEVNFKVVFGSEEWPVYKDSEYLDGFGIYLNGSNIAYSVGLPINIHHPDMRAISGTELNAVLAPGNNPVLTFSAPVVPGSTGNRLTFILADTSDSALDTTVYISSLEGRLVTSADLAVTATSTPDPVVVGSNVTCTVAVTNNGPDTASNAVVTATIASGFQINSVSTIGVPYLINGRTITFNVGTVFPGGGSVFTLDLTALVTGRLTNVVSATSDTADLTPGNDSTRAISTVTPRGAYANIASVTIADGGPAVTYPSIINVSGMAGTISSMTVTLNALYHTYPADLDILLVGPLGQKALLMSDVGSGFDIAGINIVFDDASTNALPANALITSGIYRPTNLGDGDIFLSPAPAGPYGSVLSTFIGTDPNGAWSLYIMDDQGSDSGLLAGGWGLNFTTGSSAVVRITRSGTDVVIAWQASLGGTLQTAAEPTGPWSDVGVAPTLVNGTYTVTLPASSARQFFRLRQP